MPPNLGGFFMVRSYYPSECHADYFVFERMEVLKPAIDFCGFSFLSHFYMFCLYFLFSYLLNLLTILNQLFRLVAFLLFLNPQCLASISRWITASSSWKRFCLFVCRALSSIMVICMLTAIRLLLTFVMSLYLLLRS